MVPLLSTTPSPWRARALHPTTTSHSHGEVAPAHPRTPATGTGTHPHRNICTYIPANILHTCTSWHMDVSDHPCWRCRLLPERGRPVVPRIAARCGTRSSADGALGGLRAKAVLIEHLRARSVTAFAREVSQRGCHAEGKTLHLRRSQSTR